MRERERERDGGSRSGEGEMRGRQAGQVSPAGRDNSWITMW